VIVTNGRLKQIQNVMYVVGIKKNLISVSTIADKYLKVDFVKPHYVVKYMHDHYNIIAIEVRVGGLYKLDVTRNRHQALKSITMPTKVLWNQRYDHLNYNDL